MPTIHRRVTPGLSFLGSSDPTYLIIIICAAVLALGSCISWYYCFYTKRKATVQAVPRVLFDPLKSTELDQPVYRLRSDAN
ncbi:hypothetical protein BCR33DRAFT_718675 [Rhizoclosmatium globosum]|uniref:Uncharacterized protein n=1 Tax=Rhizoclosmatium globosum TaxID=329046 RepID=A0A1Y2C598_9FUNG|nr:hypothetical protein BCR33DRAFT_718675 [Rhizoclosmatium globosum]|eukprot:ORY42057.1 hypothetical protein BCR33DRAFT_718675 [Rhizoclosmatium globosum]